MTLCEPPFAENNPILYVNMDNVLVDFQSGINAMSEDVLKEYEGRYDDIPGIYAKMRPRDGAIRAIYLLSRMYDIYVFSSASWGNYSSWSNKFIWLKTFLLGVCDVRLILSHHKDLNRGDFLIDDCERKDVKEFCERLIIFDSERFPDWSSVLSFLVALRHKSK